MSESISRNRVLTIDLDRSRAPRAFRDQNSLWARDLARIYRLIKHQVDLIAPDKKDDEQESECRSKHRKSERPWLSIAIFGPSGCGKSSLLRTLVGDVERPRLLPASLRSKVASLPVTDPTTWSSNEQFLYAFLASALEREQDAQHDDEGPRTLARGLTPVQLAFQDVNEYLRVVDDPGKTDENDPLGLSLQKLERHTSGLRLRAALGTFIDSLAAALQAKVVLLPVDDLDMAPEHLVESLQAYQSFLVHPKLIPIFTFTERMPEELIEAHFRQRLRLKGDSGSPRAQREDNDYSRLTIAEQMAVQFLSRCFPVRNRIRLGPAPARVQRAVYQSKHGTREDNSENPKVLELLITASFLLFGYPDEEDAHRVRAALRPSTLRRQLQVVDGMADCFLHTLRSPQLAQMSLLEDSTSEQLKSLGQLAADDKLHLPALSLKPGWDSEPENRLRNRWSALQGYLLAPSRASNDMKRPHGAGYLKLAHELRKLNRNATWGTIFDRASWTLLNVHRDTLRELSLYLEDLYSWSPRELRSVVLNKILSQQGGVRRMVVDRWLNRTDYRRSQVLSLLAANIFRPWMVGEEPYGDEEAAVRAQQRIDSHPEESIDQSWNPSENNSYPLLEPVQVCDRLTISSIHGLLWFIEVTMGFYLPQVVARNWRLSISGDDNLTERFSGNGWDLQRAPVNAVRVADAKQEGTAFGMLFLDAVGYSRALDPQDNWQDKLKRQKVLPLHEDQEAANFDLEALAQELDELQPVEPKTTPAGRLLLRLWTCYGFSQGRYWAVLSLWRGLGIIGQVLELELRKRQPLEKLAAFYTAKLSEHTTGSLYPRLTNLIREQEEKANAESAPDAQELVRIYQSLCQDLERLLRSHCLAGMVPGAFLERTKEERSMHLAFPSWQPHDLETEGAIRTLAQDLLDWLIFNWHDKIFPLPAGDIWIGWRDDFVRRLHGDLILGSLWPHMKGNYLDSHLRYDSGQELACLRSLRVDGSKASRHFNATQIATGTHVSHWTASLAVSTWSDTLLTYWRGCPSLLKLLLTCPVFLRSPQRFGPLPVDSDSQPLNEVTQHDFRTTLQNLRDIPQADGKRPASIEATGPERVRLAWLHRLAIPAEVWDTIVDYWQSCAGTPPDTEPAQQTGDSEPETAEAEEAAAEERQAPGTGSSPPPLLVDVHDLVPDEFCIQRIPLQVFSFAGDPE